MRSPNFFKIPLLHRCVFMELRQISNTACKVDGRNDLQYHVQYNQARSLRGFGKGGSIKSSGGALGNFGAANEEGYFFQKQLEQLKELKEKLKLQKGQEKGKDAEKKKEGDE